MLINIRDRVNNDLKEYAESRQKSMNDAIDELISLLPPTLLKQWESYPKAAVAWNSLQISLNSMLECRIGENSEATITSTKDYTEYLNECLDHIMITIVTELHSKIVLKGGYLLEQLLPNTARQSQDVDFSIADSVLYPKLQEVLENIAEYFLQLGYIDKYNIKSTITETQSGGINMYKNVNGNCIRILGVDIGLHPLNYGIATTVIKSIAVSTFSIERILADKLTAILSRTRFRRPKDLYDFYIITNAFDIDLKKLTEFLYLRTKSEELWSPYPFNDDVLRQYKNAYDKLSITTINKTTIQKPDYSVVIARVSDIAVAVLQQHYTKWSHTEGWCVC